MFELSLEYRGVAIKITSDIRNTDIKELRRKVDLIIDTFELNPSMAEMMYDPDANDSDIGKD